MIAGETGPRMLWKRSVKEISRIKNHILLVSAAATSMHQPNFIKHLYLLVTRARVWRNGLLPLCGFNKNPYSETNSYHLKVFCPAFSRLVGWLVGSSKNNVDLHRNIAICSTLTHMCSTHSTNIALPYLVRIIYALSGDKWQGYEILNNW